MSSLEFEIGKYYYCNEPTLGTYSSQIIKISNTKEEHWDDKKCSIEAVFCLNKQYFGEELGNGFYAYKKNIRPLTIEHLLVDVTLIRDSDIKFLKDRLIELASQ